MAEKPIQIIHIMPQIGIGGAETQLAMLISNSDPNEVRHEVLYYDDSGDYEGYKLFDSLGIHYSRVIRNKKSPIQFLRNFVREIKSRKPDIVHCWLVSGNFWGRLAAILAGYRHIVVSWRSSKVWKPRGFRMLEWITFRRVYHLANSRASANMVAEAIGVSSDRFEMIHNGIDTSLYGMPVRRNEIFKEINIPEGCKIVTMVGRLTEAKNYRMLLCTAKHCKDMSLPVYFLIVGHGEKEVELKTFASELDINNTVCFLGFRNDIPRILAASDVFLFTTNYEGFPNALLEAMATGLPVITTDFAGFDELVQEGITGRIVPMDDAKAACACLKNYIDNPVDAKALAREGQLFVRERFAIQKMVNNTCLFYQAILSK